MSVHRMPLRQYDPRDFVRRGNESLNKYLIRLGASGIKNGKVQFAANYELAVAYIAEMFSTTHEAVIEAAHSLKEAVA